ncbi:ZYRO0C17468p [Zygosaccharomyces rouxii]|uniref:ZYRO0C17468p n=1 Tax=Zygosaccharomyces rouxii (strain ATCC 2623 / CBS 732 / NBRC 1130 / NCYC 568 / NRRL Y-229) TaxID=559307 RepID=C5DUK2_ZYGRC|nr:uncharacterized protein ZYRO0C17468g [Zygosaccharomyces rouxii]KAH9201366.1 hypothetical protein LQ764DRAFT_208130 [Zygosaccharomyces rouxii]CAR27463.1 ZYRO0C17468p [Zygosaccharomyces rouxii]
MSQSLAHLIKKKIFLGNSSLIPIEDDRRKKGKKWGRKKDDDSGNKETLASPTKNQTHTNDVGFHSPLSRLNSIGEESSNSRIEEKSETDIPTVSNMIGSVGVDETDEDSESSEDDIAGEGQNDEELPQSPVESDDSEKRPSKLHMLKSRISVPELSFKPPMLGHRHHRPDSHNRQRSLDKSPSKVQTNSPNSVSMSPSSFTTHRPSYEKSPSGLGSIYKLGSNSSASSSRFFYSPKRSGSNAAANGTISRMTPNCGSNSNVSNKPNNASALVNSSSSSQQLMRGHARNNSVEMKPVKPQPLPFGRRRSKTLDTYGDHKGGWDATSELLTTINAHLSSSRGGSIKSRSPSVKNQETAAAVAADGVPLPSATPPRFSNGGSNSNIGSIPFPAAPIPPQPPTSMSRRGSSIANAFNSFVNLRSFSTTSSKGMGTANNSKLELSLTPDLPPPPVPDEDDSREEYLMKLSPYGNEIGPILTETDDSFRRDCLNYFLLHHFDFTDCPLDIAMRILLIFLKLPKETQQIDRLLIEFSKVYYEVQCGDTANSSFWVDQNQLYFLSFSLLMLHTDYFSPKNKFKMTKNEFVSLIHEDTESYGYKVPTEILSYFYDNVTAKEFPKFEFTPQAPSQSIESSESESDHDGLKLYSPLDILKTQSVFSNSDFAPSTNMRTDRTSSSSFSSYLPHGPTSGSSSSLAQDDVDIYGHIFDNALPLLSLQPSVQKLWDKDYMFELFNGENKYNKYFSIFKEAKGGYLRLDKASLQKLSFPNFDVLNPSDEDSTCMYLKIFQMGRIEELTVNRKFSIVGSANKTMWKKKLGVLTSCGLLMFDHHDWINPQLVKDEYTGTSNYIINYHPSSAMTVESPIPLKGLLAVNKSHKLLRQALSRSEAIGDETEPRSNLTNTSNILDGQYSGDTDDDCIMRLYGSQRAKVWRCSSSYERDNWIDAINLVAACDGCFIDSNTVPNTVVSARKYEVKEKVKRLQSTGMQKQRNLEESENLLSLYGQTIPICTRTKNELLFHVKQLAVTMEWLVYEIKRSEINLKILEQLGSQFDDGHEEKEDYGGSELVDDHTDSTMKPQQQTLHEPTSSMTAHDPISSTPTRRPFIFDGELMQRDFSKKHDAVVYEQTEVNSSEILTSY